mgnify:FL=1
MQAHLAFLTGGYKRGVLLFGRQTGKTYFSVNHGWLSAVIQQGRYGIVFKTYKQAHEVVWKQYLHVIPKELIAKTNEQDLTIEFRYVNGPVRLPDGTLVQVEHDENKPPSTLQLLGSDQADSHRGFRMDGLIFDEYGDQSADNWTTVYEPMFSTTNGWAIFMGTPRGYNHFYDLIQYAKEQDHWFYLEATWRDSPYVTKEFIENVKADAEKQGKLSGFMQEYELEFRAVQGAVYPSFNRNVHVKKPSEFPDDLTYYGAIDFGWHTTAFLLIGIDKDQNWWILDEVYGRQETFDSVLPRIKQRVGDRRPVLVIADSANRDAIEIMNRDFAVFGINKANDSKGYSTGISLITQKLKPRMQLIGPPKPSLFISVSCKNLLYELESYKYPEEKEERNPSEIPIKEDDHGPDALRYFALHMKFGLPKDDKIPPSSSLKELGEYGF